MRKKLKSYGLAALLIMAVIFVHEVLGNHRGLNPAYALPSVYADDTAIPERTLRLLRSVIYRPDNLLYVTAKDVRALLHEPEMSRIDVPTMVWQYRSDECVLDIFFKTKSDNDADAPVKHYEIRARGQGAADYHVRKTCVRGIMAARTTPQMVDVSKIYKRP